MLWLLSGFAGLVIGIDKKQFSAQEMRAPAELNDISSYRHAHIFFDALEKFITDRVASRSKYIALYQGIGIESFTSRYSNNSSSLVGKDGWLFLGNFYNNVLDYTKNRTNYSNAEINDKIARLKEIQDIATSQHIPYVMIVAPNKHTIYGEFLPRWLTPKTDQRLADIINDQSKQSGLFFVFPKSEILTEKNIADKQDKRLYLKDDTHWNGYGAMIAFKQIWKTLQTQGNFIDFTEALTQKKIEKKHNGDLIAIGKYSDKYKDRVDYKYELDVLPNKKTVKNGHLLVLGDSFTHALMPLYELFFEKVTRLDWDKVNTKQYKDLIIELKPDAIVYQVVERHLRTNGMLN